MSSTISTTSASTLFDRLTRLKRNAKFADREYRHATAEAEIRRGIRAQVRTLRDSRRWSQTELAERIAKLTGTSALTVQPNISRLESKRDGYPRIQTLLQIAEAFDVALVVRFVPFSELSEWTGTYSREAAAPEDYDSEIARVTKYESALADVQPQLRNVALYKTSAGAATPVFSKRVGGFEYEKKGTPYG